MIVILAYQLFHLGYGVLSSTVHMYGNIWNLSPYHYALFIAKIIEVLIVLIVCKPYGIGAHGEDEINVLLVHFFCQCIANSCPVLMS